LDFKQADLSTFTTCAIADHVGKYTNGADGILKMKIPTFPTPAEPPQGADAGVVRN